MAGFTAEIKAAELQALQRKVVAAKTNVLLSNTAMTRGILEEVKSITAPETPLGPAHFGYHGRDTLRVEVKTTGLKVVGKLLAAIQLYWREFGTRGGRRKQGRIGLSTRESRLAAGFTGGEHAFMTAHKAAAGFRKLVNFYYGGMAKWWNSPPA